ncbi:aminoacyl-histidine dipeptidase [Acidaminobacter sp.]|uniref:aminoacyl-histidine dipeptidase n=1 Tax=Acidaminobacter sp. TaxID=1872102 RepID=UPI0025647FBA|nr:aminoacyl-histidine dipeptidase [Acidaminobacter sp.]MDK9711272.1 aminoacyl-histidine dipeptidase [Acidaminobacter sp.]
MSKQLEVEAHLQHPVFHFFREISAIPRESGHERAISDYLVSFGRARGLETLQDEVLNVILKKPASPGYENAPAVIIQGHMDMVCEKNKGISHDFQNDPLKLRVEGEMLYATDTTLGADNGVALAYGLALLDDKTLAHPALEVVFTTEEETTFLGANALEASHFMGKILINLDSEEDDALLVSSAGGVGIGLTLQVEWVEVEKEQVPIRLSVKGLQGGHSGMEIDKWRGNAIKLLGRVLQELVARQGFGLAYLEGGSQRNAISREAEAVLMVPVEAIERFEKWASELQEALRQEFYLKDPKLRLEWVRDEAWLGEGDHRQIMNCESAVKVMQAITLIPDGVHTMSAEMRGLVESSSNLGLLRTTETGVYFENEVRSAVRSQKSVLMSRFEALADLLGAVWDSFEAYPEWPIDPSSKIRTLCEQVYERMYGSKPRIVACHAGIECGMFIEKIEGLDAISIGPQLYDVHNPNEHFSIPSVIKTWEYLVEVLKAIG